MAIYSLNHKSIGRSTHRAGRAGAHIRYISRRTAEPVILSEHMPSDWRKAKRWMDSQERGDRKNARVVDQIMVALPRELTMAQRMILVREFVRSITKGQAPWYAAIHQKGKDKHNPHAHIVIRDRSVIDGRRVACLSERESTARIRAEWSQRLNMALRAAGIYNQVVDHRSHQARGITQVPGRHLGPKNRSQKSGPTVSKNCAKIHPQKSHQSFAPIGP